MKRFFFFFQWCKFVLSFSGVVVFLLSVTEFLLHLLCVPLPCTDAVLL